MKMIPMNLRLAHAFKSLFDWRRSVAPPSSPTEVERFLRALHNVAPKAGQGSYAFADKDGAGVGWTQFIVESHNALTLHRLWVTKPGRGHGSMMLRTLCGLADVHQVELRLKAIPFGRKPHPFSKQGLVDWYRKHGFEGNAGRMRRLPLPYSHTLTHAQQPLETSPQHA